MAQEAPAADLHTFTDQLCESMIGTSRARSVGTQRSQISAEQADVSGLGRVFGYAGIVAMQLFSLVELLLAGDLFSALKLSDRHSREVARIAEIRTAAAGFHQHTW